MQNRGWRQKAIGTLIGIFFVLGVASLGTVSAADDMEQLKQRWENWPGV